MAKKSDTTKLVEIASKYIGTEEYPYGSNNVIFNTEYYGREVSGENYRWCMTFVWFVFKEAGLSDKFYGGGKTASCTTLRDYHRDKIVTSNFRPGDIIFFNFKKSTLDPINSTCYHCGICTSSTSSTVTTIDGNTSDDNPENGGAVEKKSRSIKNVVCGIRLVGDGVEVKYQNATLPIIKYGANMPAVKAVQGALNALGYDCGDVDGIYGDNTRRGICAFQQAHGLMVDGDVGKDTYKKIFAIE